MSNNTCQECGRWTHFANVGYCSRKCEQQLERLEAYKAYYRNGYERLSWAILDCHRAGFSIRKISEILRVDIGVIENAWEILLQDAR